MSQTTANQKNMNYYEYYPPIVSNIEKSGK